MQIKSGKLESDKAYILNHLIKKDSTIEQLQFVFTMQYSTITARLSELMDTGVVYIKHRNRNNRLSLFAYEGRRSKQAVNRKKRNNIRLNKAILTVQSFGFEIVKKAYHEG